MRIGYFGGSFDPPHGGHYAVARAAADTFDLDRVLFVPTAGQPLKPGGLIAPYADRLAMVEILCAPDSRFEASPLEAPNAGIHAPNYTVDTLTTLRSTLTPDDTIFVLVGADAFLDLRRWRDPDRLLTLADWIVVSRPGFSLRNLIQLNLTPTQLERVHLLPTLEDPTTATTLRTQLAAGDSPTALPQTLLDYIHRFHLYEAPE